MEATVYHQGANGLAERAVHTVKRLLQAWSPNINISFEAFRRRAMLTHRNTSKTKGKTPVELPLGRRVKLPAKADFELCELIVLRSMKRRRQFLLPLSLGRAWTQLSYSPKTQN